MTTVGSIVWVEIVNQCWLIFSGVRQASRPVFIQGYRQAPHRSQDRAYEDKNVKSVRLKQHISKSSAVF